MDAATQRILKAAESARTSAYDANARHAAMKQEIAQLKDSLNRLTEYVRALERRLASLEIVTRSEE